MPAPSVFCRGFPHAGDRIRTGRNCIIGALTIIRRFSILNFRRDSMVLAYYSLWSYRIHNFPMRVGSLLGMISRRNISLTTFGQP